MLDDETLRDGLQSPSVRCPTIDEKIRILHLIDRLGHRHRQHRPARAPARRWRPTSSGSPARLPEQRLARAGELRRADGHCRHPADRRDRAARRACRSSAARSSARARCGNTRRAGALDQLLRLTEEAIGFAVREGLPVMYVTEDTTRARPRHAAPAVFDRDPRRRRPRLRRRHRRPCRAVGRGRGGPFRRDGGRRVRRGRRDRLARPSRPRPGASRTRWRRSRRARPGFTAPRSGSASGWGTRRWTRCS